MIRVLLVHHLLGHLCLELVLLLLLLLLLLLEYGEVRGVHKLVSANENISVTLCIGPTAASHALHLVLVQSLQLLLLDELLEGVHGALCVQAG